MANNYFCLIHLFIDFKFVLPLQLQGTFSKNVPGVEYLRFSNNDLTCKKDNAVFIFSFMYNVYNVAVGQPQV